MQLLLPSWVVFLWAAFVNIERFLKGSSLFGRESFGSVLAFSVTSWFDLTVGGELPNEFLFERVYFED